jgi:hypothetical protein
VLIVGVVSLTGCAGQHDGPAAVHDGAARHTTSVQGYVGLFGGPLNPRSGAMALQDSPAAHVRVVAEAGAVTVASTVTTDDGRFTLRLTPGRYRIKAACGLGANLVVHDERPSHVDIRCDVK